MAEYGELNGGVFQIEVPQEWNGDLVVYFPGSHRFTSELYAEPPIARSYFISHGFAWASTSYSTNSSISGVEAEQAAALWDYFAGKYGEPKTTYAAGDSAGADGALASVERYGSRFDGALVACGVAGVFPSYDFSADLLAAGAFAADVTQEQFESTSLRELVRNEIEGVINSDEVIRTRFLAIWMDLTGGSRSFFVEGYELRPDIWSLLIADLSFNLADNSERHYQFSDASGIDEDDFNQRAIRVKRDSEWSADPGDPTGDIKGPVLLLHTTGDGIVPLSDARLNVQRIEVQGKDDLVRVLVFEKAAHCGFSPEDYVDAFEALVRWVKVGDVPAEPYLSGKAFLSIN